MTYGVISHWTSTVAIASSRGLVLPIAISPARLLEHPRDHGVQRAVDRLGPPDRHVDEPERPDFAPAYEIRLECASYGTAFEAAHR